MTIRRCKVAGRVLAATMAKLCARLDGGFSASDRLRPLARRPLSERSMFAVLISSNRR